MKIVGDRNFKSGTQCDVLSLEALLQGQSGRDESLICDRSYLIDSASTASDTPKSHIWSVGCHRIMIWD
jgi:hypothetical protein